MPVRLHEVVSHLDAVLEIDRFRDYGPNGLQVEARPEVTRVVTGVSANLALFERALELDADLIVAHHGLIWGRGIERVTGAAARRLSFLLRHGISLAAYHLPLDKHESLGNNAGLADAIGLEPQRGSFGDIRGHALGMAGSWAEPIPRDKALERIAEGVCGGQQPQFVFPHGPETIRRVGLCTGAASDLLEDAVAAGCDLFITGELAERAGEMARELQVTLVAAGHYRTEVYGPARIGQEIGRQWKELEVSFVDVPSPL